MQLPGPIALAFRIVYAGPGQRVEMGAQLARPATDGARRLRRRHGADRGVRELLLQAKTAVLASAPRKTVFAVYWAEDADRTRRWSPFQLGLL